jgi:hypothetical protein
VKRGAHIRVKGDSVEIRFEWLEFDGDDCFEDFHIDVATEGGNKRFDFGACAVNGLRRLIRFFANTAESEHSGGFQNPDVRYYDVLRKKDGYRLVIRFAEEGFHEEVYIRNPQIEMDDEFMRTVYSS